MGTRSDVPKSKGKIMAKKTIDPTDLAFLEDVEMQITTVAKVSTAGRKEQPNPMENKFLATRDLPDGEMGQVTVRSDQAGGVISLLRRAANKHEMGVKIQLFDSPDAASPFPQREVLNGQLPADAPVWVAFRAGKRRAKKSSKDNGDAAE